MEDGEIHDQLPVEGTIYIQIHCMYMYIVTCIVQFAKLSVVWYHKCITYNISVLFLVYMHIFYHTCTGTSKLVWLFLMVMKMMMTKKKVNLLSIFLAAQIDPEKIIEYPGFTVIPPEGVKDVSLIREFIYSISWQRWEHIVLEPLST